MTGTRWSRIGSQFLGGVATILGVGILWELISRAGLYNTYLFPPPSRIAKAMGDMVASGEFLADLLSSGRRYLAGFVLGSVSGVLAGFLTARVAVLRLSLGLILNYLRSTPSIALLPLAIVWFGIDEEQKIFIVTWGVVFPVWINTQAGVLEIPNEYIWAAQSLGTRGWRLYRDVYFPGALPFIVGGARIGIATAFFSLAAAEMAGAFSGLGFRIFYSHQLFRTDRMMAAILTIGALGVLADRLCVWLVRLAMPWWRADAGGR